MLADFFEKDLTYAVLGAAMEGHRELCRLLVGIQEPGFEPGEICANPVHLRCSNPSPEPRLTH